MNSKYIPYSAEAEESLLGNILLYSDAIRKAVEAGVMLMERKMNHSRMLSRRE